MRPGSDCLQAVPTQLYTQNMVAIRCYGVTSHLERQMSLLETKLFNTMVHPTLNPGQAKI